MQSRATIAALRWLIVALQLTACGRVGFDMGPAPDAGSDTDSMVGGDGDGDAVTGDGDGDGDAVTGDGDGDSVCTDLDGDGVCMADDCDDSTETGPDCSDSCTTYYIDTDGDGLGDMGASVLACTQPAGAAASSGDECPLDFDLQVATQCGCPSAPLAAGTACNDGLCPANRQCDGAGSCGTTQECLELSQVSAGIESSCAISDGGRVMCWGRGADGRLGNGGQVDYRAPVFVADIDDASQVVCGLAHCCVLHADKSVSCWGDNASGSLGDATTQDRRRPGKVQTVASAGPDNRCAYKELAGRGYWFCDDSRDWNTARANCQAEGMDLVTIETSGENAFLASNIQADYWIGATDIAVEGEWSWVNTGAQFWQGLADGAAVGGRYAGWNANEPNDQGGEHCGELQASGRWNDAICSLGRDYICEGSPRTPPQLANVIQLAAGDRFTCALLESGEVSCWGEADGGRLGNGAATDALVPSFVSGGETGGGVLDDVRWIGAGDSHACAVLGSGEVACWGSGALGQIGHGLNAAAPLPVFVHGLDDVGVCTAADRSGCLGAVAGLDGGSAHTCALHTDGTASCWGQNGSGQNGTTDDTTAHAYPKAVLGVDAVGILSDVYLIDAGGQHTCAVLRTGEAACWGEGSSGQIGDGLGAQVTHPVYVSGVDALDSCTSVTDNGVLIRVCSATVPWLTAQSRCDAMGMSLARIGSDAQNMLVDSLLGGTMWLGGSDVDVEGAWAWLDGEQFWSGGTPAAGGMSTGPYVNWQLDEPNNQGNENCVEMQNGGGWNDMNCDESRAFVCMGTPGNVVPRTDFLQIVAAPGEHTCALHVDGSVTCWGSGGQGRLGHGLVTGVSSPTRPAGMGDAVAVDAGQDHGCAVDAGGEVYCWGYNNEGALGLGDNVERWGARHVTLPGRALDIATGEHSTCALLESGTVECWGWDALGQLGDATINQPPNRSTPAPVLGISDAVQIAGGQRHYCVLTDPAPVGDGNTQVWCWGGNGGGELGAGAGGNSPTPVQVHGVDDAGLLTDAAVISAGWYHSCVVRNNGEVVCWGSGADGKLGDNTIVDRAYPATVLSTDGLGTLGSMRRSPKSLDCSQRHTCAVADDGRAYCWGHGGQGRLGNAAELDSLLPVQVAGGFEDFEQLSASSQGHTCAVRASGQVACWGQNQAGELGDNSNIDRSTPVIVDHTAAATSSGNPDLDSPVLMVTTGERQSMAVHASGAISTWGVGDRGRRGTGENQNAHLPRALARSPQR